MIYFGQTAWDGPRCLKDMINLEAYPPEVRELITDYPLHLIEVRKYEGYEDFKTDLKYVFGLLRNADTKDSMKTYVEENAEALRSLETDAYDVISVMGQMKDLQRIKEKYQNEDGRSYDMCKGMQEWLEEKLEEGLELKLVKQVCRKLRKGKTIEQIAEDLDEDIAEIRSICEAAETFAPEYDEEQVFHKVMGNSACK